MRAGLDPAAAARAGARASASARRCEPPRVTGQPTAWALAASTSPKAALSGRAQREHRVRRAAGEQGAGALALEARARPGRPRSAGRARPKRASSSGWRGRSASGPASQRRASKSALRVAHQRLEQPPVGVAVARRARPRSPRPSAPASPPCRRRAGAPAAPPGARLEAVLGQRQRREERRGQRQPVTVEQVSCTKPGQRQLGRAAAAADRVLALQHQHPARPARARSRPPGRSARSRRRRRRASRYPSFAARARAFMCASASIVTIGFTPEAVGKADPSIT